MATENIGGHCSFKKHNAGLWVKWQIKIEGYLGFPMANLLKTA
jgi:hypothetical protein